MKHTVYILSLLILSACKTNINPETQKKDYLTTWLEHNEQNVYAELMQKASTDSVNNTNFIGTERSLFETDTTTYLGKFTFQAQRYCDSIQVWYMYKITRNPDSPEFRILLTIDYNKKYIKAIDTILTDFKSEKYFTVEKYVQPDTLPYMYMFQNGNLIVKDIRVEINNSIPPYNLVIYIGEIKNKDLFNEIKRDIHKSLLGEEILLKKVGTIKFTDSASILNNPVTIIEARRILASD